MIPLERISPGTTVSIPSSMSFAISLILFPDASIRMHSRMDIVVLLGTALDTICIPCERYDLAILSSICILFLPLFGKWSFPDALPCRIDKIIS